MNILQFLLEELFSYQINAHRITFPNLILPAFNPTYNNSSAASPFSAFIFSTNALAVNYKKSRCTVSNSKSF